jgi:membrane-bound lytic murein transglycosylase B
MSNRQNGKKKTAMQESTDNTRVRKENDLNNHSTKQKRPFRVLMAISITFSLVLLSAAQNSHAAEDTFRPLKQRLVSDGFGQAQIAALYPPGFTPLYKTVSQTLRLRESKLNYDQFLHPSVISEARRFLRKNEGILLQAEKSYGVNRCVIVAILLVETHFGSYTGTTPTFAILSTFSLMDQRSSRERIWGLLSPQERKNWDRSEFDRRLVKRADWAYEELYALLRLTDSNPRKVSALKGSIMGAIGWPQFLPSSLMRWGIDGNGDGRIDLFQLEDAVFSTANYLRVHGWDEAGTESQKEEVIYTYNHSRPYVGAILGVARELGECPGKQATSRIDSKP